MTVQTNNERGFALVYGLVVLLIASVVGTALLYMSRKTHTGASNSANVRMASLAASAALKACEGQFLNDPSTTLAILKKYNEDNTYKWLLGNETNADSEQRIKFWNSPAGSPEYSAKILSWDSDSFVITIEGTGYLPRGGKKRALATYELSGLGQEVLFSSAPNYALYLGGDIENLNSPFDIYGDVYMSLAGGAWEQRINGGSGGTIHGNLKIANHATHLLELIGATTVTGNALILGKMKMKGPFTINGKAGFTNAFPEFISTIRIGDDAFFTQSSTFGYPDCVVGLSSKTVKYNSAISSNRFKNFQKTSATMTAEEVAAELAMSTDPAEPYVINTSVIPESKIMETWGGNVTGNIVESWWANQQSAGNLFCGEWLVVRLKGGMNMSGGYFTKKVIFLTNGQPINANGNFYDCSDQSNTLIYVNGQWAYLNGMGVSAYKRFRGLIYVDNTNTSTYQFGTNAVLYGSIQHKQGKFDVNSGTLRLVFNEGSLGQSAIQEMVNCGVVEAPGGGGTPTSTGEIILTDLKIRPKLLAKQI